MRKTQKAAVIGGTVATLMAGGIAFAAWTSTGSGTGSATAGNAQGFSVTSAPVSGLYPTETGVAVSLSLVNPNPYKLSVTGIQLTGVSLTPASGKTCSPSDLSAAQNAITASQTAAQQAPVVVPANNSASPTSTGAAIAVDNAIPDCAQGGTFTLTWSATGVSTN